MGAAPHQIIEHIDMQVAAIGAAAFLLEVLALKQLLSEELERMRWGVQLYLDRWKTYARGLKPQSATTILR